MIKQILYITLFLSSFNAFSSSCSETKDDCEYYSCVESQRHCGKRGYLLGFGKKYCLKFATEDDHFSAKGKEWIQNVRECLLDNLDKSSLTMSCRKFKKQQFKAHIPCYVNTGYCELSRKDRFAVKKVIYKSLWRPSLIWSGIKVVLSCKF